MAEIEQDVHKKRRGRNLGVLAILAGVVFLLFAVTIVKLGENAGNPTAGTLWGESLIDWARE